MRVIDMAFIGLLGVMIVLWIAVLGICATAIIIGTILKKKTNHQVLGTTLRIIGFVLLIPVLVLSVILLLILTGIIN